MESSVGRGAIILRKGLGLDDIRLTTLIRIVCELNSSQPVEKSYDQNLQRFYI